MGSKHLKKAKQVKNDEFYTQITDIEKEVHHYRKQFKGKVVLCNCDDPSWSNFWKYFEANFEFLGLKKLISTHYSGSTLFEDSSSYKLEINATPCGKAGKPRKTMLTGNGDFSSDECIALMKEADIIVTNPPFSLFKEFIAQIIGLKKKFLIIGDMNANTYKEVFRLIKNNKIWLGVSPRGMDFITPSGDIKNVNTVWYTNLSHDKRNQEIILVKKYRKADYPKYHNYDAIEVSRVENIPFDYSGKMGVPITFLDKYNPEQFEIIGLANDKRVIDPAFVQGRETYLDEGHKRFVGVVLNENGVLRAPYARIIIRNKQF